MTNERFDELVAERMKSQTDNNDFISFDGGESCEDCRGWDGVSRRCDCGNRRVSWVELGGDFIGPEAD